MDIIFSRDWAMPNLDTFSVKPIGDFVKKYLKENIISVDPFARDKDWFTYTNDLNPNTKAQYHLDAEEFCKVLQDKGLKGKVDLGIMDSPYSPRQISECYKQIGKKVAMEDTQSSLLYKRVRDALDPLIKENGIVLSFGWNTVGMGIKRGYEIIEIKLVCHGGAHNDTICMAEIKNSVI